MCDNDRESISYLVALIYSSHHIIINSIKLTALRQQRVTLPSWWIQVYNENYGTTIVRGMCV